MKTSNALQFLKNPEQKLFLTAFSIAMIYSGIAHGAGAGMPWETPLNNFLTSLTGPVAKIGGVAAVVVTGLGMAFSEGGQRHAQAHHGRLRPHHRLCRHDVLPAALWLCRRRGVLDLSGDQQKCDRRGSS